MNIRDLTIEELEIVVAKLGEPRFRSTQLYEWLHGKMIYDISEAKNVNKSLIDKIKYEFDVSFPTIYKEYISKIDETRKYLILLNDGNIIESVLMKYKYGYTVCVSSEVGCDMGCKFCASTIGGLKRNLLPFEMLAQIYLISRHNDLKISNIVIMGSGEPLVNFDNVIKFLKLINSEKGQNISLRNVTISTCGIVPNIDKLSKLNLPITLALSLHAPNDEIRKKIMPIANKYDLKSTMEAMARYFISTNRRITFEYSLIKGINDGKNNAKELCKLFEDRFKNMHVDFNINLIPVNEVKESKLERPDNSNIIEFKDELEKHGLSVTIRRELGKDISGSCGQLRASVK